MWAYLAKYDRYQAAVENVVSGLVASTKPFGSTQNGNHQSKNLPSSSGLANHLNHCVNIPSLQLAVQISSAAGTDSQLASVN